MRKVVISYAREDQPFANRLVDTLKTAGFEVWWDRYIYPPDEWEAKLENVFLNWADCCVFVVSSAFNRSDYILNKEFVWAKAREAQLHTIFKSFVVKLEHDCVTEDFSRFQSANFIDWEEDIGYRRGWHQLSHHLHHHQLYPELFVNRKDETAMCAAVLENPASPGVIICNTVDRKGQRLREMGNSMLLWHLGEGYFPEVLEPPHAIVPIQWEYVIQKSGPAELISYTVELLRPYVEFTQYDAALQELGEQSQNTAARIRYTRHPDELAIGVQPGVSGFRLENQGRLKGTSGPEMFNPSWTEEWDRLWKLTEAFLEDLSDESGPTVLWLVSGPSESDWIYSLRERYRWLQGIFMKLRSVPNMWLFAAGTYPMLSGSVHGTLIELSPLREADVSLYVEKRLHGVNDTRLQHIVGHLLWRKTKGHPGKMYREFENVLDKVGIWATT